MTSAPSLRRAAALAAILVCAAAALANAPLAGRPSAATFILVQGALPWLLLWCAAALILRSGRGRIPIAPMEANAVAGCVLGLGLAWWSCLTLWSAGKDAVDLALDVMALQFRAALGAGAFTELLLWDVLGRMFAPIPGTRPLLSLRSHNGLGAAANLVMQFFVLTSVGRLSKVFARGAHVAATGN